MKKTYFKLLNKKKVLLAQTQFFYEQYEANFSKDENEEAMEYIELQEEALSEAIKRVNAELKKIREATSEEELNEWRKELKARA